MSDKGEGPCVDEAALRRLITEGSPSPSAPGRRGSTAPLEPPAQRGPFAGQRSTGGPGVAPDPEIPGNLDAVARLLNELTPAPSAGKLRGEDAAVAAFRAARDEQSAGRATGRFGRLSRRSRTAAFGVVVAALLGGGAAVASGSIPFPQPGGGSGVASPTPVPGTAPPHAPLPPNGPSAATTHRSGETRGEANGLDSDRLTAGKDSPGRLTALCRSYVKRPQPRRDSALNSPAFRPLVGAAGGPDRVPSFCGSRLSSDGPGRGSSATGGGAPPPGNSSGKHGDAPPDRRGSAGHSGGKDGDKPGGNGGQESGVSTGNGEGASGNTGNTGKGSSAGNRQDTGGASGEHGKRQHRSHVQGASGGSGGSKGKGPHGAQDSGNSNSGRGSQEAPTRGGNSNPKPR